MIDFTRELAVTVIKKALHTVADFNDTADVTLFTFAHFLDYHKAAFISSLKNEILNIKEDDYYFDVALDPGCIDNWNSINDCVKYLLKNSDRYPGDTKRLTL